MPPSPAPACDRVGCSFEIIATSAPASNASMAARMPAQPAPTTRTSCSPITFSDATGRPRSAASDLRPGGGEARVVELLEVLAEHLGELSGLLVIGGAGLPRRTRIEEPRVDARHGQGHGEPEHLVGAKPDAVELACQRRV